LLMFGILFFLKRRRENRADDKDRDSGLFGGPAPNPKISEPIYQPGMSDRSDFVHARSASGNSIPPENLQTTAYSGFYQPNQYRPLTGSTRTLVSPNQQDRNVNKLAPAFETPTRSTKPPQNGRVRALFAKTPSLRSANSVSKSRNTLGKSVASLETIDVLMPPGPPGFGMPPAGVPGYQNDRVRPRTPETSYSDVYRAAGISPPKSEYTTQPRPSVEYGSGRF